MAPKTSWEPPAEDLQIFFNAALAEAQRGGCVSVADAAHRAFVALRQPDGLWVDKPYGKNQAKLMARAFNPQQVEALNKILGISLPPRDKAQHGARGFLTKLDRDAELRERFLNSAVENLSRPHLALAFDLPLETVALALTTAIREQARPAGTGDMTDMSPEERWRWRINDVAEQRPEWAPLQQLKIGSYTMKGRRAEAQPVVIREGWPEVPDEHETDVLRQLKFKASGSSVVDEEAELLPSSLTQGSADVAPHRSGRAFIKGIMSRIGRGDKER